MIHQIGFYLLYGTVYLLSLLPLWLHYRFSDLLYLIIYYGIRYRRKIVRTNLQNSFPEKDLSELKQIERRFYVFFCDYIVENVKLLTMRKENVMKRMVFDGIDQMEESLKTHDFVCVFLGHYCNWEFAASLQWWVPDGIRCAQLYSALRNKAFDHLFFTIRSRYGGENIDKNESLRHIIGYRQRKEKLIVGFIADQAPKWLNIHHWIKFLHQDTPVFTGSERIAYKINAACYYADVEQPKRGYYHCHFRLITNDVSSYKENQLTEEYMHLLEKSIQERPSFWLWTHKRWKRQRQTSETNTSEI